MRRAVYGYVTKQGTLVLTAPGHKLPCMGLREEGYIFFSHHSLFNRVMRDNLAVKVPHIEGILHSFAYSSRFAEQDFNTLATEVK